MHEQDETACFYFQILVRPTVCTGR